MEFNTAVHTEIEVITCRHCKWSGRADECKGNYDKVLDLVLNFCPRCGSNDLTIISIEFINQE